MKHVKLPKRSKVIGHKILKKAEHVLRIEEVKVKSCETKKCSWRQEQVAK